MIQVAPNRSQNGLIALAVLGVVIVLFVATNKPLPADPAASADASQVAAETSPAPTLRPTPTAARTPRPTQAPCLLPQVLPTTATSVAIPKLEGSVGAILFASPTYAMGRDGRLAARDAESAGWEMGLWFVPRPGAEPNLITAAGPGMVIPLALAPNGEVAAVWWWPERRDAAEVRCEQGIYAVFLTRGDSRLIARGDWSVDNVEKDDWNWQDPSPHGSVSLRFLLPKASISSDGSLIAIVDGDAIDVVRTGSPRDAVRHVGECASWGWASNTPAFVAGCEDMTSAWLVDLVCCDAGWRTRSVPIPKPTIDTFPPGWEDDSNRTIGFTAGGQIRITRTYGFATGCEGPDPDCEIPPPAWAVTTLDTETLKAVHDGATVEFLFGTGARLSADSSWLYGMTYQGDPPNAVALDLSSGAIREIGSVGEAAGAASSGAAIYGWDSSGLGTVVVRVATLRGTTEVVTISWPGGAVAQTERIPVMGLWVAAGT